MSRVRPMPVQDPGAIGNHSRCLHHLVGCLFVLALVGCQSTPIPEVSLREPGWTVHQSQAVWTPPGSRSEVIGDLVWAFHSDSSQYVHFSKAGIPIVLAHRTAGNWRLDASLQRRRHGGKGAPPKSIVWFQLDSSSSTVSPWKLSDTGRTKTLLNPDTGEVLEIHHPTR